MLKTGFLDLYDNECKNAGNIGEIIAGQGEKNEECMAIYFHVDYMLFVGLAN